VTSPKKPIEMVVLPEATGEVLGNLSELREVLTNLIFNAVDAMPQGGPLTIRTWSTPADCFLSVRDSGVGMSAAVKQRVFEPLFTTKGERGTGLGLAMVYGIVQRHGAEIEIESTPGKGTLVRMIFAAVANAVTQDDTPAPYAVASRQRILIVDDDPLLLKSLSDILTGEGHEVMIANGGQAGIDMFRAAKSENNPFAVVITDLGMPYVDGRKVAAAIKGASPTTPVILLTGWGQRLLAEGDIPPHVDRVLSKPPKLRELREALAHCCPPKSL
jgi:CheY-like chemotaxis protein